MEDRLDFFLIGLLLLVVMIVLAAMARGSRYHKARSKADSRNVNAYGSPEYSLYSSTKLFSLHNRITITDENDRMVYQAASRILTLHDHTVIKDAAGHLIATIRAKFFTLHERHFVKMANGMNFELSNEIMHIIKEVTNIEGLGWQLNGNCLELNFNLSDSHGTIIAVVGSKVFSIHDRFSIDIYQPQYEKEVVAIVITLQHMLQRRRAAREAAAASGSAAAVSSSSSSGN